MHSDVPVDWQGGASLCALVSLGRYSCMPSQCALLPVLVRAVEEVKRGQLLLGASCSYFRTVSTMRVTRASIRSSKWGETPW